MRSLPLNSLDGLAFLPGAVVFVGDRRGAHAGPLHGRGGAARRFQRAFQFAVDQARAIDRRGTLGIAAGVGDGEAQFAVLHGDGVHGVHVAAIGADELAGGLGGSDSGEFDPPGARAGWVRVVRSQRPLKSESAAREGMADRRRTPNRVRIVMASLMYHEADSSTQRRRADAERTHEQVLGLLCVLCVSALNALLTPVRCPHDDGALAGVGGVGREGSIDFELHQHFGAGRDVLRRIRNRRAG